MADKKPIYLIAAAIFAGLSMIAITNNHSSSSDISFDSDWDAYAQYSPIIGIRQNIITVSGSASTSADPNQFVVSFGLETQAPTASQATQGNAQKMNAVISAVMDAGITEEEISTSTFSVSPVYDRDRTFITGYRTSNIVTVETDQLDKASEIIDSAVEAGANRVNNVFFTLSDDLRKRLSDQLIQQAVMDAEMKAELALEPLERQIVGVKSVSLDQFVAPFPVQDVRLGEAAGAPTPIFEGQHQVTMNVTVIFLIG